MDSDANYAMRILAQAGLDPQSVGTFARMVDPMHQHLSDYPAMTTSETKSRCVDLTFRKQTTITMPSTFTSGTATMRISVLPTLFSSRMKDASWAADNILVSGSSIVVGTSSNNSVLCPIMIDVVDKDTALPKTTYTASAGARSGTVGFGPFRDPSLCRSTSSELVSDDVSKMLQGQFFLKGMAIKAHDDTSAMYRRGKITMYNKQSVIPEGYVPGTYSGTVATPVLGTIQGIDQCPISTAEISTWPNTMSWGVEDGLYMVSPYDKLDSIRLPTRVTQAPILFGDFDSWKYPLVDGAVFTGGSLISNEVDAYTGEASVSNWKGPFKREPYSQFGAIFEGLQANATAQSAITITAIWHVCYFPLPTEQNLFLASHIPQPIDDIAFEKLKRVLVSLPTAYKFKENDTGGAFKKSLKLLKIVTDNLKMIPALHPFATVAGEFVNTAEVNRKLINKGVAYLRDKDNKKKVQKALESGEPTKAAQLMKKSKTPKKKSPKAK